MSAVLTITIIAFACIILIAGAYLLSERPAPPVRYLPPDPQKVYVKPSAWIGTPVDQKGRFLNYAHPFYQNYLSIIKWLPSHLLNLFLNWNKDSEAHIHSNKEFLYQNDILIWLGHASFYLNLNGVKILIDPHFFNTFIYKRHTPAPIAPELFSGIDLLLLSHDHTDHCDKKSLQLIIKNNPGITILSGLGMEKLIRSFVNQPLNIITADWYEQYPLNGSAEIYFVPSRHYCKRASNRFNRRLWGGFIIRHRMANGDQHTIYFGGDSGYDSHYIDVQTLFQPDVALLGIGAYLPKWLMHPNHMSPQDALKAFDACGATTMIPMHYGTFSLANENMKAPLELLNQHKGGRNIMVLQPGEISPLV